MYDKRTVCERYRDAEKTIADLTTENQKLRAREKTLSRIVAENARAERAAEIETAKHAPDPITGVSPAQAAKMAEYDRIDPNDFRARAAFRAKHAVALGLKR